SGCHSYSLAFSPPVFVQPVLPQTPDFATLTFRHRPYSGGSAVAVDAANANAANTVTRESPTILIDFILHPLTRPSRAGQRPVSVSPSLDGVSVAFGRNGP